MYIRKTNNEFKHYDIAMEEESKLLKIYESNIGITLSCRFNNFQSFSVISFVIKEAQTSLYPIFLKFYENIINMYQMVGKTTHENWHSLTINEEGITIISDSSLRRPNVFRIQKRDNRFVLYFINEEKEHDFQKGRTKDSSTQIQIYKVGSKLDEYVKPFVTLFQDLQNVPNTKIGEEKIRLLLSHK